MSYLPSRRIRSLLFPCIACTLILLPSVLLTACDTNISKLWNPGSSNSSNMTLGPGTQGLEVYVEPEAGDGFLVDGINSAQTSVYLEMYLLTDRKIIFALEDAAHRHLDVRVMLEPHPYGSAPPTATLDKLQAAGVKTETASPNFSLTHEKGMVLDNTIVYIMTSNFTLSALGGSSSTTNREYDIIDKNQQDVQGVVDIFNADWDRSNAQYNAPNLVVSPDNSRNDFQLLINSAQKALIIEAEEMQDMAIEQALINAAKRGVQVQVILPQGTAGDSNSQGINTIKQGGIQVKEDAQLYMHAKIIVVDGQKAFVGSENISAASLDHNRELGVLIAASNVINTLQQTFRQDWEVSVVM